MIAKSKTVLITGGAGFIGSNTLAYLFAQYPEYHYVVLDALTYAGDTRSIPERIRQAPNFTFVHGDVRNTTLVDSLVAGADFVVHLAAETHVARSISDDANFFETNVLGTREVANAVRRNRDKVEKLIHISTSEVYGTANSDFIDEIHPLNPQSPYAASKAGADRLIYAYTLCYKIPAVIVRPFNIFGPRQHPEKVIPRFITSRILGEPLTIHGTGQSKRDFIYVDDLARAIDFVLHAPAQTVVGEVFNVGSGRGYTVQYIAESVLGIMGSADDSAGAPALVNIGDRPGQVYRHASDFRKISAALGWQPAMTFESGLEKVVNWYKENKDWWDGKLAMKHVPIEVEKGKTELH